MRAAARGHDSSTTSGPAGAPGATPVRSPWTAPEHVQIGRSLSDRRRRRRRRRLAFLLVCALAAFAARDSLIEWGEEALHGAGEPVRRLRGEEQLREATSVLQHVWVEERTFDVGLEQLERYGPDVDWRDTILVTPCWDGVAAVAIAETATGDVSRLFIRGSDRGDVQGRQGCPSRLDDPQPW